MSFSVGIVGLPNVGKSTLFKALTSQQVDIADYPFTTIKPNIGTVKVPDKRLEEVANIIKPEKIVPTIIEFVDIAGLVKGAHKGEGLGNQFLAQIRECDAIVQVIDGFREKSNPKEEMETVRTELELKDLESEGKDNLLSKKPVVYLVNSPAQKTKNVEQICSAFPVPYLVMDLKLEAEISELSEEEKSELNMKPQLDQLILACYNILDLITFYTVAGFKEVRAWTIEKGALAPEAGGRVHSDFKEKFIKAEVIPWKTLIEAATWKEAKENGLIKTVSKEYAVQDGDVIEFKV
ncbi:MAG: DUF933 domain-containing protein [Candidatus Nealsonbacteria bacterium]|nr:DUF933 domain-containing protein [Candidatus Nealsonbacteria bacterium]